MRQLEDCLTSITRQRYQILVTLLTLLNRDEIPYAMSLCELQNSLNYNAETILGIDVPKELANAHEGTFLYETLLKCSKHLTPSEIEEQLTSFFRGEIKSC